MKKESFLNRMSDKLTEILAPIAEKMARSKVLSSIGEAMSASMTLILAGSFALLISKLNVGPWQSIVKSVPYLQTICNKINAVTMGMLSLYVVAFLAYIFAGKINLKEKEISAAVSVGVFLLITPFDETGSLPSAWVGTSGIIAAMIIGVLVPLGIHFLIEHKVNISLPRGVPKFVEESFRVLVPAVIIFVIAGILNVLASLTTYGDIQNLIFNLIQKPFANIGLSLPGFIFINFLTSAVFWCGIHGKAVISTIQPLLLAASAVNLAAYNANEALSNIIEYEFYQMTVPGGYGQLLIPAIIAAFLCKSKQIKSIGKASIVPAIFCIGEPVLFGLPVLFNALLLIPILIGTIFNSVYWYVLINIGLVGRFTGITLPWTTPPVLNAMLSNSTPVNAAIAAIIMLLVDIVIWLPFMKIYDKMSIEKENSETTVVE